MASRFRLAATATAVGPAPSYPRSILRSAAVNCTPRMPDLVTVDYHTLTARLESCPNAGARVALVVVWGSTGEPVPLSSISFGAPES